jgi:hypothetical protein
MPDGVLTPPGDQLPQNLQSLLAARGGCVDELEVAGLMGLQDPSIVHRWRNYRQIVSARNEAGQWVYPLWQFARKHKRVMLGVRDCLAELSCESEWEPLVFFLSPMGILGGHNPLDSLRAGKIDAAIKAARQYSSRKNL